MKKFLTSKKGLVLLATMVAAVAAAVGAYAYWTSTGTGNGTATTGTASALDVSVAVDPGLTLDGTVDVSGTVTNNTSSPIKLTQVAFNHIVCTPSEAEVALGNTTCSASWFSYTPDAFTAIELAPGDHQDFTGTLALNNSDGTNQDAAQGAGIDLYLTAS